MRVYSSPRLLAEFNDWPIGGSLRGTRVSRTTQNKHGEWCKPKFHVYGDGTAIVDGDDGKTYILQHSKNFNMISICRHDFMSPDDESSVSQRGESERFDMLMSLINSAK